MNIDAQIVNCQYQLSEIWRYIVGLKADGVPDNAPIYDVLSEKSWEWIGRWEVLASIDPEASYSVREDPITEN